MRLSKRKLAVFVAGIFLSTPVTCISDGRPPALADLFASETLEYITLAPNGRDLIAVVARPRQPGERVLEYATPQTRSDLWLLDVNGVASPRQLTFGGQSTSRGSRDGAFAPVWSPNGSRLAFLVTNGEHASLMVWERQTGAITQISSEDIDINFELSNRQGRAGYWIDEDTIVCILMTPERVVAAYNAETRTKRFITAEWKKREEGINVTKSALDTRTLSTAPAPLSQVVKINVLTRATTSLGVVSGAGPTWMSQKSWSPVRTALAVVSSVSILPNTDNTSRNTAINPIKPFIPGIVSARYRLTILPVDSKYGRQQEIDLGIADVGFQSVVVWSSDGSEVAVHAGRMGDATKRPWLVASLANGLYREIEPPTVPEDDSFALALAIWPKQSTPKPPLPRQSTVSGLPVGVKLLAYNMTSGIEVYGLDDAKIPFAGRGRGFENLPPAGPVLWVGRPNQKARVLMALNTDRPKIITPEALDVTYRGVDGENLHAGLVLPYVYEPGRRVPLVTQVYVGSVIHNPNEAISLEAALLATRGYAVLVPSMPLIEGASDSMIDVAKGVFPAIDRVIEMGIADPDRLGVMGTSGGGYSTVSLIGYSSRFKAAVAIAGAYYDEESQPAEYLFSSRYDATPQDLLFRSPPDFRDVGKGRVVEDDAWAFRRNSPILYLDRIKTPLLLIHGDRDTWPMIESEKVFFRLFRLGKPVRFVRYWGEGHLIFSPPNVRDQWNEIYAWLDEFCDVSRDSAGKMVFEGGKVKSRHGAPPFKPEDFAGSMK